MELKNKVLNEIYELKYSISNNDINTETVEPSLLKLDAEINNLHYNSTQHTINIIKSFLVTFNVHCFSDCTVFFITLSQGNRIIEYSGNEEILNEIKDLFKEEKYFYREMDKFYFKGNNYRIFYESMETVNGTYTLLTFTESVFFKPTRFHMLSDILLDIIRSLDKTNTQVFEDFFENSVIQLNSIINNNLIAEPELYLFLFENIHDFFLEVGFEILIEISDTIKKKIVDFFGDRSGVVAFSLSKYIVISSSDNLTEKKAHELLKEHLLDFFYKGIKLQYRCIRVPYNKNNSIYDVIENVYSAK